MLTILWLSMYCCASDSLVDLSKLKYANFVVKSLLRYRFVYVFACEVCLVKFVSVFAT